VKSVEGMLFVAKGGGSLQVYATGTVVVRAQDVEKASELMSLAENSIRRGMLCVGCGVCVGACPINAITKESHRVTVGEACTACGECIGKCPLVKFKREA
jgi:phosphoadenosine phosphosulfate reductase